MWRQMIDNHDRIIDMICSNRSDVSRTEGLAQFVVIMLNWKICIVVVVGLNNWRSLVACERLNIGSDSGHITIA